MRLHIGDPTERARSPVYRYNVGAVVGSSRVFIVTENQLVPVHGWTDPRNGGRRPIVLGNLMRPDELTRVLLTHLRSLVTTGQTILHPGLEDVFSFLLVASCTQERDGFRSSAAAQRSLRRRKAGARVSAPRFAARIGEATIFRRRGQRARKLPSRRSSSALVVCRAGALLPKRSEGGGACSTLSTAEVMTEMHGKARFGFRPRSTKLFGISTPAPIPSAGLLLPGMGQSHAGHAAELLRNQRGVLVPFADPKAIAREVNGLLRDGRRRNVMSENAYKLGRTMVWSNTAGVYMRSFELARRQVVGAPRKLVRGLNSVDAPPTESPLPLLSPHS